MMTMSTRQADPSPVPLQAAMVYIVDDEASMRDSLSLLLRSVGLPVKCYASPADFIADFDPDQPGCIVLDVRMPQMSGLALQDWLAIRKHDIPIIFISGHGDIPMAVGAMRSGAVDFIEKPIHDQKLLDSIHVAIKRHASSRTKREAERELERRLAPLTAREHDVLKLLMEGIATKSVARELNLSQRTVEGYRARIFEKTGVGSLTELINLHRRAS